MASNGLVELLLRLSLSRCIHPSSVPREEEEEEEEEERVV
jgi:hypothetical protein